MTSHKHIPRGIRNNNPLNIRIGNVWLGEVREPNDPDFEQFISMFYGVRAGFVLMRRYIRHYKRTTIPAIISAWAPATENNTQRYIDNVSQLSGIPIDAQLDFNDEESMVALVDAMIVQECGRHVDRDILRKGYRAA